jgi:hypothetical protein
MHFLQSPVTSCLIGHTQFPVLKQFYNSMQCYVLFNLQQIDMKVDVVSTATKKVLLKYM